jgi:hypothetical protein
MNRTQEILDAISKALRPTGINAYQLMWLVGVSVVVIVLAVILQRSIARRRENESLSSRYDVRIRKLDLTIRQLDVLDLLALHLHDRSKKYLLLTNANTFRHCMMAAGKLEPPHDAALVSLEIRLGFGATERIALALGEFLPSVGAVVKIESEGSGPRVLSHVVSTSPKVLRVRLESNPGLQRGAAVQIYAQHPSGLVVAPGTLATVDRGETIIRLTRPFDEPDNRRMADNTLKIFVKPELGSAEPEPTELRAMWSTGAMLDNPGRVFRKRDDLQIVFRRDPAKWVYVNAEVVSLKKRRRLMKVRFSHLAADQRREILGNSV